MSEQTANIGTTGNYQTIRSLVKRLRLTRILVVFISAALLVSGLATISVLTDFSPLDSNLTTVIALLNLDLVLALSLGALLARRLVAAWITRKYGSAGSRLHMKMVVSFGLVAIIPALLVVVFLGLFLNFGMETWFSDRVRTAVNASTVVAQSYLREHQKNIRGVALAMANDINRVAPRLRQNPRLFAEIVTAFANVRDLSEAVVINSSGRTLARSQLSFSLGFNFASGDLLKGVLSSRPGEVFIIENRNDNVVRAGVKLEAFVDAYLLIGRFIDAQVLEHVSQTTGAANQYALLEKSRDNLQIKFLFVFALVAFLLLLAAIWIGWSIASTISTPIGGLIDAADRVSQGDLSARVNTENTKDRDEVGILSRSFNRMTEQLDSQQQGLIEANRQLDERRRFTEVVLSGVSAGVIGLDREGRIHLSNRSAAELLSIDLDKHVEEPLGKCVSEMGPLLEQVISNPNRNAQGEIKIARDGRQRILIVSVAAEKIAQEIIGYVVTFDDVSELLSAQRKAAWADVARRIAHEIKNPLTPIQLSAERLKRKYKDEIKSDPETFLMCTDTIVRQVEDIGRMVDEFSSFARMPQPELKDVNLNDLCTQSLFLERNRYPDIDYEIVTPADPVMARVDRQQISRTLTNVLKNAAESISASITDGDDISGQINVSLENQSEQIFINVSDNGKGFPENLLDRITEPYVTTRDRGTGLGLAIATKIMEDHAGEILLRNVDTGGAQVTLIFNKNI
ncbi:MAG: PAS domain-containing sensor histidine kinase [Rhodospirillaceae bacterium]|nr:PAS domain-containing sensor histidine kinase [Rhodospirillaceae bacterium]